MTMINDNKPQGKIVIPRRVYALLVGIFLMVALQLVLVWQAFGPSFLPGDDSDLSIVFDEPQKLTADALNALVEKYCTVTPFEITGTSLEPAFINGSRQPFYTGEQCPFPALVQRGRVVLLETGAVGQWVAKFIRALPGDRLALAALGGGMNVLTVNGQKLLNSAGMPYIVRDARRGLLDLYIRDYGGVVPEKSYLLMGDQIEGALDATQFGLVNIADIKGVMRMGIDPWSLPPQATAPVPTVDEGEDTMIDHEEPPVIRMISPVDVEASETPVVEEVETEAGDIVIQTEEEDDVMDDDGDNAPEEIDSESELLIEE